MRMDGGEMHSQPVHQVLQDQGYSLETTGPDSSAQNGLAERPHKTLKNMMRCLLYSAGLGSFFMMDALVHAVWLYNRQWHSAIEDTPYHKWTGTKPSLHNTLTFGTKLLIRQTKKRPTTVDPNKYDGIFQY
mmetsp:Transcript_5974/g.9128  ORF Transcript_5974/g.9128 Transcript_5974/m.9128 type:complete len:131 (-) Transcript_5974:3720-4112(-)